MSVAVVEAALALVQTDLDTTWPDAPQLHVFWEEYDPTSEPDSYRGPGFRFALPNGDRDGQYLYVDDFDVLDERLIATVASEVRETVVLLRRQVWPHCPTHDVGLHAVGPAHPGEGRSWRDWPVAAWLCRLGGGHVLARVGQLGTQQDQSCSSL